MLPKFKFNKEYKCWNDGKADLQLTKRDVEEMSKHLLRNTKYFR